MPEKPTRMFGNDADAYEQYMGRWSRLIAPQFLDWLKAPRSSRWLDVGAGTGNLSQAILSHSDPSTVHGIDTSPGFVERAREALNDRRATFESFETEAFPVGSSTVDVVVSGLVLNFLSDVDKGLSEMLRVVKPGGTVAAYVWDYAGKMEIMRNFWDVAVALDPQASAYDEGQKEPMLCQPNPLTAHFTGAGLVDVKVQEIDAKARFADFDDYWVPFTGNQGSAPKYVASLDEESRSTLRERVRNTLPVSADGSINLVARAWAVSGKRRSV
jgi:ubiquinone/menaquinone biosynthesis C-methylase UbiE